MLAAYSLNSFLDFFHCFCSDSSYIQDFLLQSANPSPRHMAAWNHAASAECCSAWWGLSTLQHFMLIKRMSLPISYKYLYLRAFLVYQFYVYHLLVALSSALGHQPCLWFPAEQPELGWCYVLWSAICRNFVLLLFKWWVVTLRTGDGQGMFSLIPYMWSVSTV